ncbi:MAG: hypothetical protein ACJAVS_000512 [Paracoccaceae bacterium]|jgi:hypothetical protein
MMASGSARQTKGDGGLQLDEGADDAVLQAAPGQLCEES